MEVTRKNGGNPKDVKTRSWNRTPGWTTAVRRWSQSQAQLVVRVRILMLKLLVSCKTTGSTLMKILADKLVGSPPSGLRWEPSSSFDVSPFLGLLEETS